MHSLVRWQFTRQKQLAFLEDLASLMQDGVNVSQAIETIGKIHKGVVQTVALSIMSALAEGQLLADGMQAWFTPAVVEVVRAGEMGGNLGQTLEAAKSSFTEQQSALRQLVNALIYPSVVALVGLGVVVFIKNSVLVRFAEILPVARWPSVGQSLYDLGSWVQHWWWLVVLFIAASILIISRLLHAAIGPLRQWLDVMPFLSLYRELIAARFMETLGLLLKNGVTLKQALHTLQHGASPYLSWHLLQMEARLGGGSDNIADVLDTQLLSRADILRLRVTAYGQSFAPALISLGRASQARAMRAIGIAGKLLGGLLLALGGIIAMMAVVGIYSVGSSLAGVGG